MAAAVAAGGGGMDVDMYKRAPTALLPSSSLA